MTTPALTPRTRLLYGAIIAAVLAVFLEGFSYVALAVLSPRLSEPVRRTRDILHEQSVRIQQMLDSAPSLFVVFDSALGWRQRPGYRSALYTIGPQGLRGTRIYGTEPRAGVLRASAFGDSFVFGSEVGDSAAWPALIERDFPDLEVPNYGVGGYGPDQTFLDVAEHGADLHPQVIIVGWVPDDLRRTLNVYRPFLSSHEPPLVKPRFLISESGALTLAPTPLSGDADYRRILARPRDVLALGRLDYWYTPSSYRDPLYDYSASVRLLTTFWIRMSRRFGSNRLYRGAYANPASEAFRIQVALFRQTADSIRKQGARPLFVFFPDREQMERIVQGARPSYQPLLDTLRAHGLEPRDAADAFAGAPASGLPRWFMTVHFSPTGNGLVARWLGRILEEERRAPPPASR